MPKINYDKFIKYLVEHSTNDEFKNALYAQGLYFDNNELKQIEYEPEYKINESNKIEPKFKIGDWIIENGINRNPVQIKSFEEDKGVGIKVWFSNGTGTYIDFLRGYHKWTIKDAKDGDVLICPKYAGDIIPNIFIFKDVKVKDNDVFCHCSFSKTFMTEGYVANANPINTDFYPATKEQHDLLFQKMEEAGYMWDAKKRELKKIEQKRVEEKELVLKDLEWIDMETKECHCYNCELFDRKNNVCKCIDLCKNPKRTYKGYFIK